MLPNSQLSRLLSFYGFSDLILDPVLNQVFFFIPHYIIVLCFLILPEANGCLWLGRRKITYKEYKRKYTLLYFKEIVPIIPTCIQKSGGRTSKLLTVVVSREENLGERISLSRWYITVMFEFLVSLNYICNSKSSVLKINPRQIELPRYFFNR